MKQAIDYPYDELQAKPVGFVSNGCGYIDLHAVDQLRTVFTAPHAVTIRDVVGLDLRCDEPAPLATDQLREAAHALLDQLRWWGLALRGGHAACPYTS